MTVGMRQMNQMFRDFKVAEDVGQMIKLRRFEVEFEMYGTVYWDGKQRHYLISSNVDTIYNQVALLLSEGNSPLIPHIWHESALVPGGWEEEIAQSIKVIFSKALQEDYIEEYWQKIEGLTNENTNDDGVKILNPLKEALEGVFNKDYLQLFEKVLQKIYMRCNLTNSSYDFYRQWLKEMRQDMIDDTVEKDIFTKDFYGFAVKSENTKMQVFANANRHSIYEKYWQYALNGDLLVTPMLHKQVHYNYDYRLNQVRNDFLEQLSFIFNESCCEMLKQIDQLPVVVDMVQFYNQMNYYQKTHKILVRDWAIQGWRWGINHMVGK